MDKSGDGMLRDRRVLEVGGGLSASFAGMLLAAAGADVVRLETADDCWRLSTNWPDETERTYIGVLDAWLNRGKRSIAFLDARRAERHLPALIQAADLILDDADPRQRKSLGLYPPSDGLLKCHWVLMTPYGAERLDEPASDLTAAALSGAVWAIGDPTREPLTVPHHQAAIEAGLIGAFVSCAAAIDAGPPRVVDIAWTEVLATYAQVNSTVFDWEREGHRAARSGGAYPYTILPCRDGYVCLAARTNADWRRILEALGQPSWAPDPRFQDIKDMANSYADEADDGLRSVLAQFTQAELLERAARFGCAIAPVRDFRMLSEDADLRKTHAVVDHMVEGSTVSIPNFGWLSDREQRQVPSIGGDGAAILSECLSARESIAAEQDLWLENR